MSRTKSTFEIRSIIFSSLLFYCRINQPSESYCWKRTQINYVSYATANSNVAVMRAILQEIYFITKPQDFMVHDLSTSRRLHLRIDLKLTRLWKTFGSRFWRTGSRWSFVVVEDAMLMVNLQFRELNSSNRQSSKWAIKSSMSVGHPSWPQPLGHINIPHLIFPMS